MLGQWIGYLFLLLLGGGHTPKGVAYPGQVHVKLLPGAVAALGSAIDGRLCDILLGPLRRVEEQFE